MKARSELARNLALLAAPIITTALFLFTSKAPLHVLEFPDPDFGYLFNSLTILKGDSPWHIDHPGTPLQLLGALVMLIRHQLFGVERDLARDFFLHPVPYHQAIMNTAFSLFLLAQWFCGRRLWRLGIPLSLCIFAQFCPFLIWDGLVYLDHVSPETLLSATGLCLIPLLAESDFRDENKNATARALGVGICLALLASLKANSIPLIACIFLLRRPMDRITALGAFVIFYLGLTAPIWPHYPRMFSWYLSLLSHRGLYGQEPMEPSLSSIAVQASDPDLLLRIAPLLAAAWFLFFSRFLQKRYSFLQRRWPLILAGSTMLLLAIKHPASRYFLPLCIVVALGAIQICRKQKMHRLSLIAVSVFALLYSFPHRFQDQMEIRGRAAESIAQLTTILREKYSRCHLTVLDDVGIPAFTLFSGNLATEGEKFGGELKELFPATAFRQTNLPSFRFFGGSVSEADWAEAIFKAECRVVLARLRSSEENFFEVFHERPVVLDRVGPLDYFQIFGFSTTLEARYRKILADHIKEKGSVRDWTKPLK